MTTKTYVATLVRDGSSCIVAVPFDPKPIFGKLRAPVKVTLKGHTYRSTIASMGGRVFLPLRRSNREAAGLEGTETIEVTLTLDVEERIVEIPEDLAAALDAEAKTRWDALSFSHRREHVEAVLGAKRPDTRRRRIQQIADSLRSAT